jgi:hypothetical protein
MASKRDFVFRFAVGDPDKLRSTVWRLWTNDADYLKNAKSDVYLQSRMMGADTKVSLHQSGQWQWSLTQEYLAKKNSKGEILPSRHLVKWRRPAPLAPGLTYAFTIIIPSSELRVVQTNEKDLSTINWIQSPSSDSAIEFDLILADETAQRIYESKPAIDLVTLISSKRLANGETLSLFYRTARVIPENLELLRESKERVKSQTNSKVNFDNPQLRGVLFLERVDGVRGLIEIAYSNPAGP